jgi:hypothetical protein
LWRKNGRKHEKRSHSGACAAGTRERLAAAAKLKNCQFHIYFDVIQPRGHSPHLPILILYMTVNASLVPMKAS